MPKMTRINSFKIIEEKGKYRIKGDTPENSSLEVIASSFEQLVDVAAVMFDKGYDCALSKLKG